MLVKANLSFEHQIITTNSVVGGSSQPQNMNFPEAQKKTFSARLSSNSAHLGKSPRYLDKRRWRSDEYSVRFVLVTAPTRACAPPCFTDLRILTEAENAPMRSALPELVQPTQKTQFILRIVLSWFPSQLIGSPDGAAAST
jgi:hypothetical protein